MAGPLRLKGQETQIRLLRNGAPTEVTNAILSFDMNDELEVLEEAYLGETESRYDNIYKGTTISMEVHMENQAAMDHRDEVVANAQRRDGAAARFDYAFVMTTPDGASKSYVMVDVKHGNIGFSDSARADYVTAKFEGSCSVVQSINL